MVELLLQRFYLCNAYNFIFFVESEKTERFVSEVPDLPSKVPFLLGLKEYRLTEVGLENHLLIIAGFFWYQLESVLKSEAINVLEFSCLLEVVKVVRIDKLQGWPGVQAQIQLDIEGLVPQACVLLLEQETHGLVLLEGGEKF